MNKTQSAKLNMYKSVLVTLTSTDNTPIVTTIPALVGFKDDLTTLISEMEDLAEIQEDADDGVTEDKEDKRLKLCRAASNMAGLIRSWAVSTGNTIIAGQMKITYSDLTREKESLLAERCKFIHTVGTTNQVAAASYGVTVAKLTALNNLITAYEAKATAPRDAEVIIKAATTDLETKQKETDELLNDKMDPLVNSFIDDEPTFYNQYYAAREIINAPTNTTKAEGTVKKTGTEETLAEVTITATKIPDPENPLEEPAVFTTTTNALGIYNLPIPIPGFYNLTFEKETYQTHQVTNYENKLGQTQTINIELTPAP